MAEYKRVGPPTNESERVGICKLRDHLPAHYLVLGNFELQLPRRKNTLEYDAVVIGEWGIYAVEIKGWGGEIGGDQARWQLEWGPVENPFIRIEQKAKALRDLLVQNIDEFPDDLFVEAVVYLPRDDVRMNVDDPRNDRLIINGNVWEFFVGQNVEAGPGLLCDETLREEIKETILPRAKPGAVGPQVPNYHVEEELDRRDRPYQEYIGRHQLMQMRDKVRIKAYRMDPLMSGDEQDKKFTRAIRDLEALTCLEDNDYVARAYDMCRDEDDELIFYLISEWVGPRTLGDYIREEGRGGAGDDETFREKLDLALALTRAVHYVHERDIVHRNLHPDAAYLTEDASEVPLQLADFDYARLGHLQSIAGGLSAIGTEGYVAPEMWNDEPHDHRVDIYSLGVIHFELFTGVPLYQGIEDILNYEGVWQERRAMIESDELRRLLDRMLVGRPEQRLENLDEATRVFETLLVEG